MSSGLGECSKHPLDIGKTPVGSLLGLTSAYDQAAPLPSVHAVVPLFVGYAHRGEGIAVE